MPIYLSAFKPIIRHFFLIFDSMSIPASVQLSSVAQSCPTRRSHELQHIRPPCPSSTPRVYSNSCPSSQWCLLRASLYKTICYNFLKDTCVHCWVSSYPINTKSIKRFISDEQSLSGSWTLYYNILMHIIITTVRTGHGTTDWFQIRKGVHQGCILSPCLFNLYAEYIIRNAGLEEAQDGIKTAGRNINNLRYADDTTLMAESEE